MALKSYVVDSELPKEADVFKAFEAEAGVMRQLGTSKHQHLLTAVVTIYRGDRRYFLLR